MRNSFVVLLALLLSGCAAVHEDGSLIDLDRDISKDVSLYDFCSKVELFQVENRDEAYLSEIKIKSVVKLADTLIVLTNDPAIKKFSLDGKWLGDISKHGRGHGEFSMASDLKINRFENTLEVLNPVGIVYKYALDDNYRFIESVDLSDLRTPVHKFYPVGGGKYVLFSSVDDPMLCLVNPETRQRKDFEIPVPSWLVGTGFCPTGEHLFIDGTRGSLNFYESLYGSCYEYEEDSESFTLVNKWDWGAHNLDVSKIEPHDNVFDYEKPVRQSLKTSPGRFKVYASGDKIYSSFRYKSIMNIHSVIFNRETKDFLLFSKTTEGVRFWPSQYVFDNVMYAFSDPEALPLLINEEVLRDDASRQVFEDVSDDSNILLIKYYLK